MLNILLSALIDPDRRLRSFRRSERLASILVCTILGACLTSMCLFCACIFVNPCENCISQSRSSSTYLGSEYGCRFLQLFICLDPLLDMTWPFLEVILCLQTLKTCLLLPTSLAGLCLVGVNPLDHLRRGPSPSPHTEEVIMRGASLGECDCRVCLEKMERKDRVFLCARMWSPKTSVMSLHLLWPTLILHKFFA